MPSFEIAAALVAFKAAFPSLDILELIRRKPQLLRNQVPVFFASNMGDSVVCAAQR